MRRYLYWGLEIFIIIFVLCAFTFGVLNYERIQEVANKELAEYGAMAFLLMAFLLDLIPQYVPPHIGIISAPLIGMNLIYAFVLVAIGSTIGSLIGFEIGARSREKSELLKHLFGEKKFNNIQMHLNDKGKWFIALAAVSPLPYLPIIIGSFYIKRRTFWMYGLLPRVLGFFALAISIKLGFNLV